MNRQPTPAPTPGRPRGGAIALALLAALILGLVFGQRPPPDNAAPAESTDATSLLATSATRLDGQPEALARWRGKPLLINYWATWCPPCRHEMPALSRLARQHQAKNINFVGIAIDTNDNVQRFVAATPVAYPVLIGADDALARTHALGNRSDALPFTLILDANGQVRYRRVGEIEEGEVDAILQQLAQ